LINIAIQGYLTFKEPVGKRQLTLSKGSSLRDALACLQDDLSGLFEEKETNQAGELGSLIAVLLNGMHYRHLPEGLNTLLKDGDQVSIFPPVAGG
jgi:molybdopterin synthase sulfur carrier subunit